MDDAKHYCVISLTGPALGHTLWQLLRAALRFRFFVIGKSLLMRRTCVAILMKCLPPDITSMDRRRAYWALWPSSMQLRTRQSMSEITIDSAGKGSRCADDLILRLDIQTASCAGRTEGANYSYRH